jgi:gliding motility-associated lipoprotein GldK
MKGFDYQEAAKIENKGRSPKDFVYRYTVQVYPDTLVWMRDFGYSNNEQMATSYFASDKYKNFPVVGVNWKQASAYCDWFTKQRINRDQREHKMAIGGQCRLPTEAEWAYAASLNDKELNKGRTDDKITTDDQADKPKRRRSNKAGEEEAESAQGNKLFPEKVIEGKHGQYGIYNLADNVSEWTNTSYYAGGANFENRFNPDIQWGTIDSESKSKRQKVVRGGSWKDTPQFTNVSNRFFEDLGTAHSYIGFRVVVNLPE